MKHVQTLTPHLQNCVHTYAMSQSPHSKHELITITIFRKIEFVTKHVTAI